MCHVCHVTHAPGLFSGMIYTGNPLISSKVGRLHYYLGLFYNHVVLFYNSYLIAGDPGIMVFTEQDNVKMNNGFMETMN